MPGSIRAFGESDALLAADSGRRFRGPPKDVRPRRRIVLVRRVVRGALAPCTRIERRVLVVWGDADRDLGQELATLPADLVANARVVNIPGASHWVQNAAREEVNRGLLEFAREEETTLPEAKASIPASPRGGLRGGGRRRERGSEHANRSIGGDDAGVAAEKGASVPFPAVTVGPRHGDPEDHHSVPTGPGLLLSSSDMKAGFVWARSQLGGSRRAGDVVVLSASEDDADADATFSAAAFGSAQNLVVPKDATPLYAAAAASIVDKAEFM